MRSLLAVVPLILLIACAPDAQPSLHEVNLVGSEYVRVSWFYGQPRELQLADETLTLTRAPNREPGSMVVSDALDVNGQPFLREPLALLQRAPTEASYIGGSSDMRVQVGQDAAQVLYWDGAVWFTLLEDARRGVNTRVVPVPRLSGLQNLAQLTRSEADALEDYLEGRGPVVVTVLDVMPSAARTVNGIEEYLRSGFYLQRQISTIAADSGPAEDEVFFDHLASGSGATVGTDASWRLLGSQDAYLQAWNSANGTQLSPAPAPAVDFSRETVLALFMGQRPSGGYSVSVEAMRQVGSEVYVDVRFSEPAPGTMVSQALTSPWTMVRILRGNVSAVWLRDAATGEVLGAASR